MPSKNRFSPIKLTFRYDIDDWAMILVESYKARSNWHLKLMIVFACFLLTINIVTTLAILFTGGELYGFDWFIFGFCLVMLGLGSSFLFWPQLLFSIQAKRTFSKMTNIHLPIKVLFTEQGIIFENQVSKTESKWEMITHYRLKPHVLALFLNPYNAIYIPTRYIPPQEWQRLIKLVQRQVPVSK